MYEQHWNINRWLYKMFLMVDANFKLKHKKKKSSDNDDLADGLAYFVPEGRYKEHLKNHIDEKEVSKSILK